MTPDESESSRGPINAPRADVAEALARMPAAWACLDLTVDEPAGIARQGYPLRWGVPFHRGVLPDPRPAADAADRTSRHTLLHRGTRRGRPLRDRRFSRPAGRFRRALRSQHDRVSHAASARDGLCLCGVQTSGAAAPGRRVNT